MYGSSSSRLFFLLSFLSSFSFLLYHFLSFSPFHSFFFFIFFSFHFSPFLLLFLFFSLHKILFYFIFFGLFQQEETSSHFPICHVSFICFIFHLTCVTWKHALSGICHTTWLSCHVPSSKLSMWHHSMCHLTPVPRNT